MWSKHKCLQRFCIVNTLYYGATKLSNEHNSLSVLYIESHFLFKFAFYCLLRVDQKD